MAITIAKLVAEIDIQADEFKKKLNDAGDDIRNFWQEIRFGGPAISALLTAPIVAAGAAALASGLQVDEAFDAIRIKTGATGKELKGLQGDFEKVFVNVPMMAGEVGNAIGFLNSRLGLTGAPLRETSENLLELTRLTGSDLNPMLNLTTRMFGDWSISADKTANSLDFLFKVQQKTGVEITSLGEKLVQYGAPLRALGMNFNQAAALMGKWGKEGVNVELVTGSLRIALRKMAKEGIENVAEAFPRALEMIQKAGSEGEKTAMAMKLFGARAGVDMVDAIKAGRFEIDDFVKTLEKSGETIKKAAADTEDFPEMLAKLRNEVTLLLKPLGDELMGILKDLINEFKGPLTEGLRTAVKWFSELDPKVKMVIVGALAFLAALGPMLIALSALTVSIGSLLPLFGAVATFLVGPWGIAFAGAGYAIYKMVGEGAKGMDGLMKNIRQFIAWFTPFWTESWGAVKQFFVGVWQFLEGAVGGSVQFITHIVQGLIDFFKGDWESAWEEVKLAFAALWDKFVDIIVDAIPNVVSAIGRLLKSIYQAVTGGSEEQLDSMEQQVVKDSTSSLKGAAKKVKSDAEVINEWAKVGFGAVDAVADGVDKAAKDGKIDEKLGKIFAGSDKKQKKSPLQLNLEALKADLAGSINQLKELHLSGDSIAGQLMKKFRLASTTKKGNDWIESLITVKNAIKNLTNQKAEVDRFKQAVAEAKGKIEELHSTSALDAVKAKFGKTGAVSDEDLQAYATLIEGEKRLRQEQAKAREEQQRYESSVKSLRDSVADYHAQYLKLTKTNREDQLALQATGMIYEDLDEKRRKIIDDMVVWSKLIDEVHEKQKKEKEEAAVYKTASDAVAEMKGKLMELNAVRQFGDTLKANRIKPFTELKEEHQMLELEGASLQILHKSYRELDPVLQALIEEYLIYQHRVDAATDADQRRAAEIEKSKTLTTKLVEKLAEVNQKIDEVKGHSHKQSRFVTDLLAQQLQLTEEQKKLLDEIINKEKELDETAKRMKMFKQIAQEVKGFFGQTFSDIASGSKNIFASISENFTKMLQKMAAEYLANRAFQLLAGAIGGDFGAAANSIGGYAVGGTFAPGELAMVGERGPELVRFHRPGQVVPNQDLNQVGGGDIHVHQNIYTQDANSFNRSSQQTAEDTYRAIDMARKRNGFG